jgi:hypothetical protein
MLMCTSQDLNVYALEQNKWIWIDLSLLEGVDYFKVRAFTYKPERNYHFSAPGRNCMTYRQELQDIPDTSQVSVHKRKNQLTCVVRDAENDVPVT